MALLIKPNGQKLEVKPSGEGPFTDLEICAILEAQFGYSEVVQENVPEKYLLIANQEASGQFKEYNPSASKMFRVTIRGNVLLCGPEEYEPIPEPEVQKEKCVHPYKHLTFHDGFVHCLACGSENLNEGEE